MITGTLATSTARAREPSEVLVVPRWRFVEVVHDNRDVLTKLRQHAATQVQRATSGIHRGNADILVVMRDAGAAAIEASPGALTELAAWAVARLYGDRVLVIDVEPGDRSRVGRLLDPGEPGAPWRMRVRVPPARLGHRLAQIVANRAPDFAYVFLRSPPGAFSVEELVVVAKRVLFVTRDPEAEPTRELTRHCRVLVTGVLDGRRPLRPTETWMTGAVRLGIPMDDPALALDPGPDGWSASRFDPLLARWPEDLGRWARAVTHRRVGLALGGGGALGYVHVALIAALCSRGIPIDMVAGSSFGSVVGAIFASRGSEGLQRLVHVPVGIQLAAWAGFVNSAVLARTIDAMLGGHVVLPDLPIPFFPVALDVDTGTQRALKKGRIGWAVRASGSLPPIAPTTSDDGRYLDGGLVSNVPSDVLRQEWADLVIASNPIPKPRKHEHWRPDDTLVMGRIARALGGFPRARAILTDGWRATHEFNPAARARDACRMMFVMMRSTGADQSKLADVSYAVGTSLHTPLSFHASREILLDAARSEALHDAVALAEREWRRITQTTLPGDLAEVPEGAPR